MNKFANFANRKLCEYANIFPTTADLMEHLLFVIGNGYSIDEDTGMFADMDGVRLDEYPEMTSARWKKLIADCVEKERGFMVQYYGKVDESKLEERCQVYKKYSVEEYDFSEHHFFATIVGKAREREKARRGSKFVRPYPLSKNYSAIFRLNDKTPKWMIGTALNLCKAWVRFLDSEIQQGNVYNSANENVSSEDGYATLHWTALHCDMLKECVEYLQNLLWSPGTKVRIAKQDPDWNRAVCAEPKPGMEGTIVEFKEFWRDPANEGKVAIELDPRVLGYEDDGENDPVTIFFYPKNLEVL